MWPIFKPVAFVFKPVTNLVNGMGEASSMRKTARDAAAQGKEAFERGMRSAGNPVTALSTDLETMEERGAQFAEKNAERLAARQAKLLEKEMERAAKRAAKVPFMTRLGRDGVMRTLGKPALIGAGVIAGITALGIITSKVRNNRRQDSKAEAMLPPETVLPEVAETLPPISMAQPTPGAFAARVQASRGVTVNSPIPG